VHSLWLSFVLGSVLTVAAQEAPQEVPPSRRHPSSRPRDLDDRNYAGGDVFIGAAAAIAAHSLTLTVN